MLVIAALAILARKDGYHDYPTQVKVLAAYKELTGSDLFRGPALRTMRKEKFVSERVPKTPNIREGYNA